MSTPQQTVLIIGGGQSGLAAARAARDHHLRPIVLEAGERAVGSWPHYYNSLALFSPAQFSGFPGFTFPGDGDRYPTRDEVVTYLENYAESLDVEIRTNTRVRAVESDGDGFAVHTTGGDTLAAPALVAASGSFANPHLPTLPGSETFAGTIAHVADYRDPSQYQGKRVIVVGGGNSAVQVAVELARTAAVTLASRQPLQFWEQRINGLDLHHALVETGFDLLPPYWLAQLVTATLVIDTGGYQQAFATGLLDRRPMFTRFTDDGIEWPDGSREQVDAVLFATGYRPALEYLRPLGALDQTGAPLHAGGLSMTHMGLAYLGLEFQRSFSSNTLRGVHRDAEHVMAPLAAHIRGSWKATAAHQVRPSMSAV